MAPHSRVRELGSVGQAPLLTRSILIGLAHVLYLSDSFFIALLISDATVMPSRALSSALVHGLEFPEFSNTRPSQPAFLLHLAQFSQDPAQFGNSDHRPAQFFSQTAQVCALSCLNGTVWLAFGTVLSALWTSRTVSQGCTVWFAAVPRPHTQAIFNWEPKRYCFAGLES